jgi:hypothetical protein
MKRKALALAVALSLTPMAAVAGNAPRCSDSGKVRGCFLRMPQRCQEVCAASGVSNPAKANASPSAESSVLPLKNSAKTSSACRMRRNDSAA